ncbi:MAG: NAD(P)H-binding protein [Rhodothermales bacterium]|nr:NAD(P)H-binding protein [Rhodothermales bacterium]
MARTALLTGATGLVGGHLLRRLLADPTWERVVVLGRRPLDRDHPKLEQRVIDFERLPDLADMPSADDAFSCLGTTIRQAGSEEAFQRVDLDYVVAFAEAAAQHGASQFLVVSAMGADAGSRIFYNRVKGEMEVAVAALPFEAVQIARPSLLLGDRDAFRLGERVGQVLARPLAPLMLGPLRPYRPIEADAVAAALVDLAASRPVGVHVYDSGALQHRAG